MTDAPRLSRQMKSFIAAESKYYRPILADRTLLDRAVVVDGVLSSGSVIGPDGVRIPNQPEWNLPAFCVPVGGCRRGGDVGLFDRPEAAQKVIDSLTGVPGFPDPRIDGGCVMWGDDRPEVPDCEPELRRLHMDWVYGHHYGYSLTAIVFQLGRIAAMAVHPGFLKLERETTGGAQIRNFRRVSA